MNPEAGSLPLATCVMATTPGRRPFLRQALKYFARQTYPRKELIIVDDPAAPADGVAAGLPDVRVLKTTERLTLGAKLNLAIEAARGEIIQNMDDDDYFHPQFLSSTVGALVTGNSTDAIVACRSILVLLTANGELKCWNGLFAGNTLCFHRQLWARRHFRDITLGPDQEFLKDHPGVRIGLENPELFIMVRHEHGHTWSHLAESHQRDEGAAQAGEKVNAALRRLPDYPKRLAECIPPEDLGFYESLAVPAPRA